MADNVNLPVYLKNGQQSDSFLKPQEMHKNPGKHDPEVQHLMNLFRISSSERSESATE